AAGRRRAHTIGAASTTELHSPVPFEHGLDVQCDDPERAVQRGDGREPLLDGLRIQASATQNLVDHPSLVADASLVARRDDDAALVKSERAHSRGNAGMKPVAPIRKLPQIHHTMRWAGQGSGVADDLPPLRGVGDEHQGLDLRITAPVKEGSTVQDDLGGYTRPSRAPVPTCGLVQKSSHTRTKALQK